MSKETNKTNDYKRNVPVWEEIKRKVMGRNVTNVYENKKMNFYRNKRNELLCEQKCLWEQMKQIFMGTIKTIIYGNKRNELLWEQKKIIVMRKNEANVYGNK